MSASIGYQAFGYTSPTPSTADFTAMLTTEIGLSPTAITAAQAQFTASLAYAVSIVYQRLNCISNGLYLRAVYCLATDRLIQIGQDPSGAFAALRAQFAITSFVAGVISSSADESTSQSFQVSDSLASLSLMDLQNLKTPWGREYLGYAQQAAPLWGLS